MTACQALCAAILIFTTSLDMLICISTFLGLTGGRLGFSYLFLTDIVPMTHISFVSMWFSGSIAVAILGIAAYFFWIPYWRSFLIVIICLGVMLTIAGAWLLVDSPLHCLLSGDSSKANECICRIKQFNRLGSRPVSLYEISEKLKDQRNSRKETSLCCYFCCTKNVSNLLIIVTMQCISSFSTGQLFNQVLQESGIF